MHISAENYPIGSIFDVEIKDKKLVFLVTKHLIDPYSSIAPLILVDELTSTRISQDLNGEPYLFVRSEKNYSMPKTVLSMKRVG